jgi:hypothetical protein
VEYVSGKIYRTREGFKATVFLPDRGDGMALGAIYFPNIRIPMWVEATWDKDGKFVWSQDGKVVAHEFEGAYNIVGEWREPAKYSVEVWVNTSRLESYAGGNLVQYLFGKDCKGWDKKQFEAYDVKCRVTVEEIRDDR